MTTPDRRKLEQDRDDARTELSASLSLLNLLLLAWRASDKGGRDEETFANAHGHGVEEAQLAAAKYTNAAAALRRCP